MILVQQLSSPELSCLSKWTFWMHFDISEEAQLIFTGLFIFPFKHIISTI